MPTVGPRWWDIGIHCKILSTLLNVGKCWKGNVKKKSVVCMHSSLVVRNKKLTKAECR